MKIVLHNHIHYIIYIDYQGKFPHSVKTKRFIEKAEKPYWRTYDWDFFLNNNDESDLRYYHAGNGGDPKDISYSQWADGYLGKFWHCKSLKKLKGKLKNGIRLKNPILLKMFYSKFKTTKNPFLAAEECNHYEFCDICEHHSTETCWEHKFEDEKGNLKYIHDNSCAE